MQQQLKQGLQDKSHDLGKLSSTKIHNKKQNTFPIGLIQKTLELDAW